MQKKIRTIPYL